VESRSSQGMRGYVPESMGRQRPLARGSASNLTLWLFAVDRGGVVCFGVGMFKKRSRSSRRENNFDRGARGLEEQRLDPRKTRLLIGRVRFKGA
jgi:hypothetical protein